MNMVSSNDVDICVTCIADKPPRLPLREELVSLGVEVVYNASGTGSKVANRETRRRIKGYRKEAELRKSKSSKQFCESEKDLLEQKRKEKLVEKKLRKAQTGISYESYCSVLNADESSDDSSSLSSLSSFSTCKSNNIYEVGTTHLAIVPEEHGHEELCYGNLKTNNRETAQQEDGPLPDQMTNPEEGNSCNCLLTHKPNMQKIGKEDADTNRVISKESSTSIRDKTEVTTPTEFTSNSQTQNIPSESPKSKVKKLQSESFGSDSEGSTFLKPESEMKALVSGSGNRWWYEKASPIEAHQTLRKDEVDSESNILAPVADEEYSIEQYGDTFDETPDNSSEETLPIKFGIESERLSSDAEGGKSDSINYTESELFEILKLPSTTSDDIDQKHAIRPRPVSQTLPCGKLPLHEICCLGLQHKLKDGSFNSNLNILLSDLNNFKTVLHAVIECDIGACRVSDCHGDLPIHLVGRRLIEWEERWRSTFIDRKSIKDSDVAKIEMLYQGMSFCVELVLKPIVGSRGLCRNGGSVGRLLPLHIACIFPISTEKTKNLLETYPEAAEVQCNFGDITTTIKNSSLALELLTRRRGISSLASDGKLNILMADDEELHDLVFAFYPNVDPFRRETGRLQRLESLIMSCTKRHLDERSAGKSSKLDAAAQSAWVWLCTFDNSIDGIVDDYSTNVHNIVCGLGVTEVSILASVKTYSGTILNIATKACVDIIKARLISGKIMQTGISKKNNSTKAGLCNESACVKIDVWSVPCIDQKKIDKNGTKETICPAVAQPENEVQRCPQGNENEQTYFFGSLLKKIFNIRGHAHPTSFIILPYTLVKAADGSVLPEDGLCTPVATQFSKYLSKMTNPKFLSHQLEKKSISHLAYNLPVSEMEEWTKTEEKERNLEKEFLELYCSKPAYLYLLDDEDGFPILEGHNGEKNYPVKIDDAMDIVRQMLPIMLQGMILMRGDLSLVVLIRTIIEGGPSIPDEWIEVGKVILNLLYEANLNSDVRIDAALGLKEALADFLENCSKERKTPRILTADGSEWIIELTLLKLSLDSSEIRRSFAGLQPMISAGNGEAVWTLHRDSKSFMKGGFSENLVSKTIVKDFSLAGVQSVEKHNCSLEEAQTNEESEATYKHISCHTLKGSKQTSDNTNKGNERLLPRRIPPLHLQKGSFGIREAVCDQSALHESVKNTENGIEPGLAHSSSTATTQLHIYKSFSPREAWTNFLSQKGGDFITKNQSSSDDDSLRVIPSGSHNLNHEVASTRICSKGNFISQETSSKEISDDEIEGVLEQIATSNTHMTKRSTKMKEKEIEKHAEVFFTPEGVSQIKPSIRVSTATSQETDGCLYNETDSSRTIERAISLMSFNDEQSGTTAGSYPRTMNLNRILKQSVSDLSIQSTPFVSQELGKSHKLSSFLQNGDYHGTEKTEVGTKIESEVKNCQITTSNHQQLEGLRVGVAVNETYTFDIAEATEEKVIPLYRGDAIALDGYVCERKHKRLALSRKQSFEIRNSNASNKKKGATTLNTDDSMKKLMTRLVNLEDRLLRREMELDKVKHELNNFELELICQSEDWEFALQLEVD